MMDPSMKVDIYIDPNNFQEGALQLARRARPNWTGDISLKVWDGLYHTRMLGDRQIFTTSTDFLQWDNKQNAWILSARR